LPVWKVLSGNVLRPQDVPQLELGKPIQRETGSEDHLYRINVKSGQFLQAVVDQRGIQIVVEVFDPAGKKLVELDSPNDAWGPERVTLIATVTGSYRLALRAKEKDIPGGRYEVRLEASREATGEDKSRVAAEISFIEAERLRGLGTAEAWRQAIGKYEESRSLWQSVGDSNREAEALGDIGSLWDVLGDTGRAQDCYDRSLGLFQSTRDRRGEAGALSHLGELTWELGKRSQALEYHQQSLALRQAVGDEFGQAESLHNIGSTFDDLGEKEKALDYLNRALELRKSIRDRKGEAATLNYIGDVYNEVGERTKALDYFNQALPIRRSVHDVRGEGITLSNIAFAYESIGERQKAMDYFEQALDLHRRTGDPRAEATTLNNMGILFRRLGLPEAALDLFTQALSLYKEMNERDGVAVALHNIGYEYESIGDKEKALDYYNDALQVRREVKDRAGEAFTLNNIGAVHDSLGDSQQALQFYREALSLHREVRNQPGEVFTLINLGKLHNKAGDTGKAVEHYTQAIALAHRISDRYSEAAALRGLARIESAEGNVSPARADIEAAIAIIESLRANILGPELRASYFASVNDYYNQYIDVLMRLNGMQATQGFDALAFQASERGRTRSLLELLTEAQVDIRQGVDSALLERERSLQQLIERRAEVLRRLLNTDEEEQAEQARRTIAALTAQLQEVQSEIRSKSPRYAELMQPQPLSVREIQEQVLDPDSLLLEYSLGEERSYGWAISPDSIFSFELPKRSVIESAVRAVYELLTARGQHVEGETPEGRRRRIARADALFQSSAAALSSMVLGPVVAHLKAKRIVVVSDGALQYVPFAVLPTPYAKAPLYPTSGIERPHGTKFVSAGSPLVVDHEIVSLPSASALAVLRREIAGRRMAPKVAAVIADPVYEATDLRVKRGTVGVMHAPVGPASVNVPNALAEQIRTRSLIDSGLLRGDHAIPRLPFSQREAEVIRRLVPNESQRKLLVGFDANHAAVTDPELGNYRLVHFGTHSVVDIKHPELTGIILSLVDKDGRPQDQGILTLGEVYNLKLPAEMIVLSACQTALGAEIRGEGLVGLTRGFMYAGAARVMASLWEVDDEATAELMSLVYEGVLGQEHLAPAAALRHAQIQMMRRSQWHAPYYWSAFTIQGEWK
jgi:CHAT domain-containing protein/Tfp pilus assembly protein PilF